MASMRKRVDLAMIAARGQAERVRDRTHQHVMERGVGWLCLYRTKVQPRGARPCGRCGRDLDKTARTKGGDHIIPAPIRARANRVEKPEQVSKRKQAMLELAKRLR